MPLRLLRPETPGQGTDPPKRRKWSRCPALTLTAEEVRGIRATLVNAARAYGGPDVLAAAMGVPVEVLYKAKRARNPGGVLAIRLAAAAGISVEAMLRPTLAAVPSPGAPPKDGAS